jgi:uncharacterized membrane protein YdjX (TVP38/TMEM64 family)
MSPPEVTQSTEGFRRLLARAHSRAALPYLGMAVLLGIAIVVAGDEIEHHLNAIEAWIAALGPWSVLAFIGLFVLAASVLIPDTVLSIMAGALFGLGWGMVAVVAGSLLAASLQYALSRGILRTMIDRTLAARPSLVAIQRAVRRDEVRLQALLRLTPLNPATISYALGAAGVRFQGFLVACLALVPNLALEVYFGYAGKHVARMAGRQAGAVRLHDITVIGGLAVTIVVMVLVSRLARKAVMAAVSEAKNGESAGAAG